jgi:hypothetical protein
MRKARGMERMRRMRIMMAAIMPPFRLEWVFVGASSRPSVEEAEV